MKHRESFENRKFRLSRTPRSVAPYEGDRAGEQAEFEATIDRIRAQLADAARMFEVARRARRISRGAILVLTFAACVILGGWLL